MEYKLDTVLGDDVDVEIEGVGKFSVAIRGLNLAEQAAHAYAILTGKVIRGNVFDVFELVSADQQAMKARFRVKDGAPIETSTLHPRQN